MTSGAGDGPRYRRLRAPRENRAVLIEPVGVDLAELVANNRARLDDSRANWAGLTLAELRAQVRQELLPALAAYGTSDLPGGPAAGEPTAGEPPAAPTHALDAPLLLSGHQPALFHPGVWAKNFGLAAAARRLAGWGLNLVIDTDTCQATSINVPGGELSDPTQAAIPFDAPAAEVPWEERSPVDRGVAQDFPDAVRHQLGGLIPRPFLDEFWPTVLARLERTDRWGLALAQARHQFERKWGSSNQELPQSAVCRLAGFRRWLAALAERAESFREVHNAALAAYRRANHLRSRNHPVPELARQADWCELPLWVWSDHAPRRRRLFAQASGGRIGLADLAGWECWLPVGTSAAATAAQVAALAEVEAQGVRIRTRALATTLFARLVVGDLFVHGIGGAKYDELTDEIVRRWCGIEPPAFLILSATLELPLARPRVTPADVTEVDRQLRELTYHPERAIELDAIAESNERRTVAEFLAEKARWVAAEPTPATARERCRAIRELNAALQPWVAEARARWQAEEPRRARLARATRLLSSREYAFPLYPIETLREFMLEISSRTS